MNISMIITDGKTNLPEGVYTRAVIGKFDGVHRGHTHLLEKMVSAEGNLKSLVFTFSFASTVSFNEAYIYSEEERRKIFENLGVDYLVEYYLDKESAAVSPEDFVRDILVKRLHVKEVYCGPDLSFARNGKGNIETIYSLSDELGIKAVVIEKEQFEGEDISSSRIREKIKRGDVSAAEAMLGRKIMQSDHIAEE